MEKILAELNKAGTGIIGSMVVGEDGIPVVTDFSTPINDEMVAALVSSITNSANKVVQKLANGQEMDSFIIETNDNKIFLKQSKLGYLVILTSADANLGLVRVEMKTASKRLDALA
jgi:predicted regulator of Ras-like GTPase activity (Roadblock/LC7/MglB family)